MTKTTRNRTSSTIPFGYKIHPDNDHLIIEDDEEQVMIREIREMSKAQSLRDLIQFVKAHTGRELTPRGIQKVIKRKY